MSALSIQGLSTLNAVLGSTESSRAVAAIITLIRDELNKPDADGHGEVANYVDLLVATVGFVLLQRWGRRKTEMEFRDAGGEETIWDTVIDDKGFRADVVGTKRKDLVTATKNITRATTNGGVDEDNTFFLEKGLDIDPQPISLSAYDQTNMSDEEIRNRILSQLPPGTRATITTDTMTMKKITVEIHEGETAYIEPPPGLTMVSESLNHHQLENDTSVPQQTIVFRTSLKRSSSADIEPIERLKLTSTKDVDTDPGDSEDVVMMSSMTKRKPTAENRRATVDYTNEDKPLPQTPNPVANQKKSRKPVTFNGTAPETKASRLPVAKQKRDRENTKADGTSDAFKRALKSLSPTQSFANVRQQYPTTPNRSETLPVQQLTTSPSKNGISQPTPKRVFPMPPSTIPTPMTSPSLTSSRRDLSATYFTMHEKKRESTVSQTDTYSIHSNESRPSSPTMFRTHAKSASGISRTRSQTELALSGVDRPESRDGERHHRRSHSFVPSLYSMGTKHSDEAIILAPKTPHHHSIFEDHKMLVALATDGKVPGMFPKHHLVKTIRRFARFASASYGSSFLRVMGIAAAESALVKTSSNTTDDIHHEHSSFLTHTGLPADSILLSSFVDHKGATGNTNLPSSAMSPLVHFVSVDHDSKAVVLTCRGTLGFEDVLADMTCDYDDISWQGQTYKVHKGIHASARRLLGGVGSRVMATIQAALEQFPEYGLVLCGHSLGGAVAAVVGVLISERSKAEDADAAFVTAEARKLLTQSSGISSAPIIAVPVGRPIHVYAYGAPATFSPSLRLATRGLITTVINANDVVPHLSLGTLHDFRSVALHLKKDTTNTMSTLKDRVVSRIKDGIASMVWAGPEKGPPPPQNMAGDGVGEDNWAWTALTTLRKQMTSEKLVPPGECFVIETSRVFDRFDPDEASGLGNEEHPEASYFRALGRPATRVQFKLIRDVERRFGELRFGSHMFGDHSPGRYEAGLGALEKGICED